MTVAEGYAVGVPASRGTPIDSTAIKNKQDAVWTPKRADQYIQPGPNWTFPAVY